MPDHRRNDKRANVLVLFDVIRLRIEQALSNSSEIVVVDCLAACEAGTSYALVRRDANHVIPV